MNSGFKDRLKACTKHVGSVAALMRMTGIPRTTLDGYLAGTSEPQASKIADIARATGVSVGWLILGQGEMFSQGNAENTHPLVPPPFAIDPELMGKINDVISRTYKDIGGRISPADMGRMAAKWYSFMVNVGSDPVARTAALAVLATQLKAELTVPVAVDANNKRRA